LSCLVPCQQLFFLSDRIHPLAVQGVTRYDDISCLK